MMGKEFSEFQVEPVSGGTPESGQAIWQRVWKLQLERKCFYPIRDVQLGLGLFEDVPPMDTWSKCLPVEKKEVCRKSGFPHWFSLLLMAFEVWCIFWRKISKHWILLENYSFLFITFISCLFICPFLLSEETPSIHGSQRVGHDWLTEQQQPNNIQLLQ